MQNSRAWDFRFCRACSKFKFSTSRIPAEVHPFGVRTSCFWRSNSRESTVQTAACSRRVSDAPRLALCRILHEVCAESELPAILVCAQTPHFYHASEDKRRFKQFLGACSQAGCLARQKSIGSACSCPSANVSSHSGGSRYSSHCTYVSLSYLSISFNCCVSL